LAIVATGALLQTDLSLVWQAISLIVLWGPVALVHGRVINRSNETTLTKAKLKAVVASTNLQLGVNYFGGSLHDYHRQELKNYDNHYYYLDGTDEEILAQGQQILREGKGDKNLKVAFVVPRVSAQTLLQLKLSGPRNVQSGVFLGAGTPSLKALRHITDGFITDQEFKRGARFFFAKSYEDDLASFVDIPDLDASRYRFLILLTRTLDPLVIEVGANQLKDLKARLELILRQA
jgi:hypothetical protein